MNKKNNLPYSLNWLDLNWEKKKYKNIWVLTLSNQTEDYYDLVTNYGNLFSEIFLEIKKLNLFASTPRINVALFPSEIFAEKTKIPFSWGIGCVRSTNGKFSDTLCYKYIPSRKIPTFNRSTLEGKRGNIHEVVHLFFAKQIPFSTRAINEGFAEFVPRILFNLQKGLTESTNYFNSLTEKDIVTFGEIDTKGLAYFSSELIGKNKAYASAFLGILWLVDAFCGKNKNYFTGAKKLIKILSDCKNAEECYESIYKKTKVDLRNSKAPILEGINLLKTK
ncbi:hypothetical protein KAJ87_00030 [Candidatus Pacearchaeota archaeon]|nr:hypothetical protein [Candidatus Pacearchaeota archaeon]